MAVQDVVRVRRLHAGVGVVAASGLAGAAVFAHFAIADRALTEVAGDQFAVFYTLSVIIGFGAFQPLETEMARTLAHRDDPAVGLREAATATAVVALAVTALVAAAAVPLLALFGRGDAAAGDGGWLLAATVAVVGASALQFWVRGALLGRGRPVAFAATIVVDSVLRLVVAGAVVLALGTPSAAAFALSLLLPLLLAHLAFAPAAARGGTRAAPAPVARTPVARAPRSDPRALLRRVSPLFAATLSAQVLAGAPVLVVAALAPGAALAFLFSFTVARVPLFMAVPVQSALVPPMAAMVVAGRLDRLVRLLLVVAGVVTAVAVVGGGLAARLGPPVLEAAFPGAGSLPGGDLALMVVGVAAHVGLLVTAQANAAAGHHRGAAAAWVVGLALAAVVFAAGPLLDPLLGTADAVRRVEWAFAAGSAAGWALAVALLVRHARRERARRTAGPDAPRTRPDAEEPA